MASSKKSLPHCRRYAQALSYARKALQEKPDAFFAMCIIASQAVSGQVSDAEHTMARLREREPLLRISNFQARNSLGRPEDFDKFAGGLRRAGLQE